MKTGLRSAIAFVSCVVIVACRSPERERRWIQDTSLVLSTTTPDEKKARAANVVANLGDEVTQLQARLKTLGDAAAKSDSKEIDAASMAVQQSVDRLIDTQDPEASPWRRVFSTKSPQEMATVLSNVTFRDLQAALAQDQEVQEVKKQKEQSLEGFNFGTGIGATFDLHGGTRVKSASIRDGVVRADEDDDAQVGLVLETHYFIPSDHPRLWGTGPFVAIRTGEDDVIDEAGLGWMIGFRREVDDENSFNIGLGVMVDPDAEVLADGFTENQAPPVGATDVAIKKEERFSFAIVFSYTF